MEEKTVKNTVNTQAINICIYLNCMKKILPLLFLSFGLIVQPYAHSRPLEVYCNEGFDMNSSGMCIKQGEEINNILDEDGQKKGEYVNKDGKLFKLTLFYKNGQKEIETVNIFDNGYWNEYFSWHENGQKESEYSYNKENKKDGKWTYWNEDGEITSEVIYKDGVCLSGDCPN
jgi:antitoxin component YwqK of YwqJK toxin-antitoxin module